MKKILITLISVAVAIVAMAAGSKLWVHSHSGNHLSIDIADLDSIGFTNDGSGTLNIKDVCGNTYKCVTIGSQVWMAENMRCNKYDTQSERAGASLSTSSTPTYAPYYVDASNTNNWESTKYSGNLSNEQISKLGYLYNWAAAVGLATESAVKNQTSDFSGKRQGICPNGWHVPTYAEWSTLENYVGSNAGTKLKTTSGWYSGGNGTDAYSFAALPAGYASGSTVYDVGNRAYFSTATPYDSFYAYGRYLYCITDLLDGVNYGKSYARSVRCVKTSLVQSVSLSKTSHTFQKIGESIQLTATVLPSDASNPSVTWKSSNESVATVSASGLVTCKGFGDATITATADDKSATCNVSATKISVQSVTLSKTSYAFVTIGQTLQLTATVLPSNATYPNVTWETSNAAVATVSDNGLVTCNGFGDATITATADGKSATCAVNATLISVRTVTLSKTSYAFQAVGESVQLTATVLPANASYPNVTWETSNAAVATVSDNGLVTCKGFGDAIITATADGKSSTCTISASPISVLNVVLSRTSYEFHTIGESVQLTATVLPANATYPSVTWKSSNTAVATVNSTGVVTCKGTGNATITATADGKCASCTVSANCGTVTDACGNQYSYVKIGNQYWLAENMRCNKYDTQSERAGATLSTLGYSTSLPYYRDGRNDTSSHSGNLTSEQRIKLGYLYNWAAAVGAIESVDVNQTSSFSGNRQGICPNGWHVPTSAEWSKLENYVGSNAGTKLMTTSGWCNNGNATDSYSFAALPAGYVSRGELKGVGICASFWTATPDDRSNAYYHYLFYDGDMYSDNNYKSSARSVRCVKN